MKRKENVSAFNPEAERSVLRALAEAEDLIEKKAKIYSRLLTDQAIAEDMETIAIRHADRKAGLNKFLGIECEKSEKSEKSGKCENGKDDGNGGNVGENKGEKAE